MLITLDELQPAEPTQLQQLATAVQDLLRDNFNIGPGAAGPPEDVEKLCSMRTPPLSAGRKVSTWFWWQRMTDNADTRKKTRPGGIPGVGAG